MSLQQLGLDSIIYSRETRGKKGSASDNANLGVLSSWVLVGLVVLKSDLTKSVVVVCLELARHDSVHNLRA